MAKPPSGVVGLCQFAPESLDIPENMTLLESKPGLTPETMNNQWNVAFVWVAKNWSGACDELAKIAKPKREQMIITSCHMEMP